MLAFHTLQSSGGDSLSKHLDLAELITQQNKIKSEIQISQGILALHLTDSFFNNFMNWMFLT